jgi:hypothetical protein
MMNFAIFLLISRVVFATLSFDKYGFVEIPLNDDGYDDDQPPSYLDATKNDPPHASLFCSEELDDLDLCDHPIPSHSELSDMDSNEQSSGSGSQNFNFAGFRSSSDSFGVGARERLHETSSFFRCERNAYQESASILPDRHKHLPLRNSLVFPCFETVQFTEESTDNMFLNRERFRNEPFKHNEAGKPVSGTLKRKTSASNWQFSLSPLFANGISFGVFDTMGNREYMRWLAIDARAALGRLKWLPQGDNSEWQDLRETENDYFSDEEFAQMNPAERILAMMTLSVINRYQDGQLDPFSFRAIMFTYNQSTANLHYAIRGQFEARLFDYNGLLISKITGNPSHFYIPPPTSANGTVIHQKFHSGTVFGVVTRVMITTRKEIWRILRQDRLTTAIRSHLDRYILTVAPSLEHFTYSLTEYLHQQMAYIYNGKLEFTKEQFIQVTIFE